MRYLVKKKKLSRSIFLCIYDFVHITQPCAELQRFKAKCFSADIWERLSVWKILQQL